MRDLIMITAFTYTLDDGSGSVCWDISLAESLLSRPGRKGITMEVPRDEMALLALQASTRLGGLSAWTESSSRSFRCAKTADTSGSSLPCSEYRCRAATLPMRRSMSRRS